MILKCLTLEQSRNFIMLIVYFEHSMLISVWYLKLRFLKFFLLGVQLSIQRWLMNRHLLLLCENTVWGFHPEIGLRILMLRESERRLCFEFHCFITPSFKDQNESAPQDYQWMTQRIHFHDHWQPLKRHLKWCLSKSLSKDLHWLKIKNLN